MTAQLSLFDLPASEPVAPRAPLAWRHPDQDVLDVVNQWRIEPDGPHECWLVNPSLGLWLYHWGDADSAVARIVTIAEMVARPQRRVTT